METTLNNSSNNYVAQYEGEIVYGLGGDDYLVADGSKWAGDDFFFPTPLTLGGALDDPFDSDQWSPVVLYGGDGFDTLHLSHTTNEAWNFSLASGISTSGFSAIGFEELHFSGGDGAESVTGGV